MKQFDLTEILKYSDYQNANPQLVSLLQSVLFIQTEPMTISTIKTKFSEYYTQEEIETALGALFSIHNSMGIRLQRIGGGYLFTTAPENAKQLSKILSPAKAKLSKPSLETMAIIAYRQPVTQNEINDIRGVNSESSIKLLLERNLIKIVGRKNEPGRPFLYATTKEFLTFMGINALAELPSLDEFQDQPTTQTTNELISQNNEKISTLISATQDQPDFTEELNSITENFNKVEEIQKKLLLSLGIVYEEQTIKTTQNKNNVVNNLVHPKNSDTE